jgi:Mg2+-importing ATPase
MNPPPFWSNSVDEVPYDFIRKRLSILISTDDKNLMITKGALIVLVVRSRKPLVRSRPGRHLFLATFLIVILALSLPFTTLAELFDFQRMPIAFYVMIGLIVLLYITAAEVMKKIFFRRDKF